MSSQDPLTNDTAVTGEVDQAVLDEAYGEITAAPLQAKAPVAKAPAGKTPKAGEVTILSFFDWVPAITEAQEVQFLLDNQWHPSYRDYQEITGVLENDYPGNFVALLGRITEYKPKSIKRLNYWTHANKELIGITGSIIPGDVLFNKSINANEISELANTGLSFTYQGQSFTLDDVRNRFTDDGLFVLYGCNAAFNPSGLLTALKNLLQVTVIGFKTENMYCPPPQTKGAVTFNRKGEKVGVNKSGFSCAKDATQDWRSLIKDPNSVRIDK